MRSKDFDPDQALDRAMHLFWGRGYEATSVADLVHHLGIARASLYGTFGSKQQLFELALRRYCLVQAGPVMDRLENADPVLPALRDLLRGLAEAAGDPARRGCLVVNAATERIPADPGITAMIVDHLDRDEQILARALARGQASGEIDATTDPSAMARYLIVVIQGMRVSGKVTANPEVLGDVVDVVLRALRT